MIERNVILGGRGSGKTYRIMTEIHELLTTGQRPEVLVVFPTLDYLHWWVRMWQDRFPHIQPPDYVSIASMHRIRGRRFSKVYVEDVDSVRDGIYNEAFRDIEIAIAHSEDPEITFVSNWILENQKAHRAPKQTSRSVLRRLAIQRGT